MPTFDFNKDSNTLHCVLHGRLGSDTCESIAPQIREQLKALSTKSQNPAQAQVVFDLEQVDFIASGFIRICIETAKTVTSRNFSVVNTRPVIKKTFKIAGLDKTLNVT